MILIKSFLTTKRKLLFALCLLFSLNSLFSQTDTASASSETETDDNPIAADGDRVAQFYATEFDLRSPVAWMERLALAIDSLNFEITFVASNSGADIEPYIWRHAHLNSGDEIEMLSSLNGPGFERILVNDKLSVFEPGLPPYTVSAGYLDSPIPTAFYRSPSAYQKAYDIILMGRARILGRMAQQIRIISKDKTRYGYYLWIDEQSGLLLKLNMFDGDKSLLKQIQVTQLLIGDQVQQVFNNLQKEQLPPVSRLANEIFEEFIWELAFLPEGMKIVKQTLHRLSDTGQPAQYMLLSDGLVDVSVYVMNDNEVFDEQMSVNAQARSFVSKSNGKLQVSIIGDIPIETAEKMADSIELVEGPQP